MPDLQKIRMDRIHGRRTHPPERPSRRGARPRRLFRFRLRFRPQPLGDDQVRNYRHAPLSKRRRPFPFAVLTPKRYVLGRIERVSRKPRGNFLEKIAHALEPSGKPLFRPWNHWSILFIALNPRHRKFSIAHGIVVLALARGGRLCQCENRVFAAKNL